MRLENKTGIITAAASGMGQAGALRFAREGAAVAVVDIVMTATAERHGRGDRWGGGRIATQTPRYCRPSTPGESRGESRASSCP